MMLKLCKLISRNRLELAVMESLDSGKPIKDCVEIDIPETIETIKWHAESIDKIYDQTAPAGDKRDGDDSARACRCCSGSFAMEFPVVDACLENRTSTRCG